MTNVFADYAASRVRRAPRAAAAPRAPMKPSPMEQKQRDQSAQLARYKKAKRADHENLRLSEHRREYNALLDVLKTLTPKVSHELLAHVRRASWIKRLDDQQRHTVISIIGRRIVKLRELQGLAPFDDPLPGAPPNLFLLIRKEIMGV